MKRFNSISLAAAVILTAGILMTGCGGEKDTDAPTTTETATVAVTEATSTATTEAITVAASTAEISSEPEDITESAHNDSEPNADIYGNLSRQEAIDKTILTFGNSYTVQSVEQRYLRNTEAWFVTLASPDGDTYYAYVNNDICIGQTDIPYLSE